MDLTRRGSSVSSFSEYSLEEELSAELPSARLDWASPFGYVALFLELLLTFALII